MIRVTDLDVDNLRGISPTSSIISVARVKNKILIRFSPDFSGLNTYATMTLKNKVLKDKLARRSEKWKRPPVVPRGKIGVLTNRYKSYIEFKGLDFTIKGGGFSQILTTRTSQWSLPQIPRRQLPIDGVASPIYALGIADDEHRRVA